MISIQCKPPSASITASIRVQNWEHAFSTSAGGSSANTRHMVAIRLTLVLWEVMLVMFLMYDQMKLSSGFMLGEEVGPVREGYKVVALLLKPSLGLFRLVGWHRVLLPHPGSANGHLIASGDHHTLQHIQVHFGVDLEDVRWHDVALTWNHIKTITLAGNFVFITLGTSLLFVAIQCCHDLDPVIITWIGREYELYNGTSPISLIEHCVSFRYHRRLLLFLGFEHNWPTSRWSATKKEKRFSLNRNGIMSSFLGRQFYHATLYIFLSECAQKDIQNLSLNSIRCKLKKVFLKFACCQLKAFNQWLLPL